MTVRLEDDVIQLFSPCCGTHCLPFQRRLRSGLRWVRS
jgi:hypothetical protein